MANYSHEDYKKLGPNVLATSADRVALVKNPTKGDTFAQFKAKVIAEATITSAAISFAASGNDLLVTVAAQNGVDPSGTAVVGDDLSVAVYSEAQQKVFIVMDATNRVITNDTGDRVNIPALVTYIREPVAV